MADETIIPTPAPTATVPDTDKLDEVVNRRIASYVKKAHDAIDERDEVKGQLSALQAELALEREEKTQTKIALKELELNEKFPLAAEHLRKLPGIGLTATSPEDYEVKMAELNTHLAATSTPAPVVTTPAGTPPSSFVAPTGITTPAPVPEEVKSVVQMSSADYAKLPQEQREQLLRGLDDK